MDENTQINQHNSIVTELEADLSRAYQIINQQQEYINQLQQQLSHNQQEKSHYPADTTKPQQRVRKRVIYTKKSTGQLSSLQFTSLVTIIVVLMSFVSFAIMRRQNPRPSSQQTQTQSKNILKPQESIPSIPSLPNQPTIIKTPDILSPSLELVYNVPFDPDIRKSQKLQLIVDEVVNLASNTGLPKKPLSITLIDLKTRTYAEFQQEKPRFPASVVKMFWMVYLYAQIATGVRNEAAFEAYLDAMIKKSDNNAASDILDNITQTQSGKNLEGKEFEDWLKRRKQVNIFFQKAGYKKINISQKTFPITKQKIYQPQGADLKMRGDLQQPIRNRITTQQAARLLYEIYEGQAISPDYSIRMASWLSIDDATRLQKKDEQNPNEFNSVRGFFSESLPLDVYFGAKAGWTSGSRQEAAYIATRDGKAAYILVVFAEDKAYAYDWKIFPKISEIVFQRMTNSN